MATYFVMGADHREYGPASIDELRKWVAEGRADAQSKVRVEGTSEWIPLSHVPEFADAPARKAPPALHPIQPPAPASRVSGMAVAALILGILGLPSCGGTALLGLALGIIAMVRVTNSRGALTGKGLALGGIIVSAVDLLLLLLLIPLLLPALAAAHDKARQINCMNNEKQLALAVIMYADDHANHYPPAAAWCDAIRSKVSAEGTFKCPAADIRAVVITPSMPSWTAWRRAKSIRKPWSSLMRTAAGMRMAGPNCWPRATGGSK